MRSFCAILVASVLPALVGTSPAAAQTASRIGPSITAIAAGTRGTNSAYDFKNSQYLVVSAYGNLNGVFVTADGVPGTPFLLQTPGTVSHFPGVTYSPDLYGGAGGFLVTWHQSLGPNDARVHARFVSATGVLGPEIVAPACTVCAVSAAGSTWEAVADVAYSTTSKEFLVVWQGIGITAQRIGLDGQLIGGNFNVTPPLYRRDPAVVYNPTTNEFMVGFGGYDGSGFAAFQRVAAGSGALLGPETILGRAAGVYIVEVAYNATTNQYLVAWSQGGTYGRLIDAGGNILTNAVLLSTTVTAYDALGIDYNTSSGTFMMVSHRTDSFQDGGVELSGAGLNPDAPIVTTATPAKIGNFYPKVSSRVGKAEWLLTTSLDYGATTVQRLGSTAAGGAVGGGGGGAGGSPTPANVTAAKADFFGFAKTDLLLQRDDGNLFVWAMDGATAAGLPLSPGSVDPNWRIVATGDLTGDGRPEIVWQHTNGWLSVWYMNGATMVNSELLNPGQIDTNWKIVGAGDFNGDGKADLVWQHTSGWLAVWYMNGRTMVSSQLLNPGQVADGNWKIVGVGDFNGDGKPDLVWQHTNGLLSVWYMNGPNLVGAVFLNPAQVADPGWKIRAVIDLNGDGKTDLVWQHMSVGWLSAWFMDGITAVQMAWLNPSGIGSSWKVMGPR